MHLERRLFSDWLSWVCQSEYVASFPHLLQGLIELSLACNTTGILGKAAAIVQCCDCASESQ